jgi:hypothetical protein
MLEAAEGHAVSTTVPLMEIEAMYPGKRMTHLLVDNSVDHTKLVQAWLVRARLPDPASLHPGLLPAPIERLWPF